MAIDGRAAPGTRPRVRRRRGAALVGPRGPRVRYGHVVGEETGQVEAIFRPPAGQLSADSDAVKHQPAHHPVSAFDNPRVPA